MVNQELVRAFKNMRVEDLKEFVDANEQLGYADDSKVRILVKKYCPKACEHGFVFGLNEMYVALAHALYERLDETMSAIDEIVEPWDIEQLTEDI